MMIEYNDVWLDVIDLLKFERVNVYTEDKADLLYVRYNIGAACTIAPGGSPRVVSCTALSRSTEQVLDGVDPTANNLLVTPRGLNPERPGTLGSSAPTRGIPALERNEPPGPIPASKWRTGPETDAELRNRLAIPRRKLRVWAFSAQTGQPIRWLESPRRGFTVDATVGPTPLSWDVVSASGEPTSLSVFFQISTDVTPCPVGSDRFVLSHRWETTHGYNEDHYLTRKIDGEIIFHAGVRDLIGVNPDAVRNQFIHPIPLGFQRIPVQIVGSSDGLTFRYTILDIDPTIVFSPGDSGATQISIAEKVTVISSVGDTGAFLP